MDRASIKLAANELFREGHFSGVIAVCTDALVDDTDDLEVRTLLTRALLALRKDSGAERQLAEILRIDQNSSIAYQLLGEIAFRRDDLATAEIYFREACRLDRGNASARIWLDVTLVSGGFSPLEDGDAVLGARVKPATSSPRHVPPRRGRRRRFADGTAPQWRAETASAGPRDITRRGHRGSPGASASASTMIESRASSVGSRSGCAASSGHGPERERLGGYLVENGMLSAKQLHESLIYQRRQGVRVGEAAVALGFISQQKLGWAALGFHSRHRR